MGIRESLEQPDQDLNLKKFTMPEDEPEQDFEFDAEKELGEYQQEMKRYLESFRGKSLLDFIRFAAKYLIVFPDHSEELNLDDTTWQESKQMIDRFHKNGNWDSYNQPAFALKIIFPNHIDELNLDENSWQGMLNLADFEYCENDAIFSQIIDMTYLRILFPDQAKVLANKIDYERDIDLLNYFYNKEDWKSFAELAMCLKIIFPDHSKDFKLDQKSAQGMKQTLKEYLNKKDWWKSAEMAKNLQILFAKEVKITDHGLELVMPEKQSHQQKIPPRPERRT